MQEGTCQAVSCKYPRLGKLQCASIWCSKSWNQTILATVNLFSARNKSWVVCIIEHPKKKIQNSVWTWSWCRRGTPGMFWEGPRFAVSAHQLSVLYVFDCLQNSQIKFPLPHRVSKRLHHPRFTTNRPHTFFHWGVWAAEYEHRLSGTLRIHLTQCVWEKNKNKQKMSCFVLLWICSLFDCFHCLRREASDNPFTFTIVGSSCTWETCHQRKSLLVEHAYILYTHFWCKWYIRYVPIVGGPAHHFTPPPSTKSCPLAGRHWLSLSLKQAAKTACYHMHSDFNTWVIVNTSLVSQIWNDNRSFTAVWRKWSRLI